MGVAPGWKRSGTGGKSADRGSVTDSFSWQDTSPRAEAAGRTPLQQHGALHVSGTDLKDSHGSSVQLKGVSTHGIAWFPQYVNKKAFQTLRDRYGINLIRLAMYTNTSEGYGAVSIKKVQEGVKYATQLGMYVIIDWHILNDGNPNQHKSQAKKFFRKMAKKYKNQKNVLYEICNEPNGNVTWEKDIKPYAKSIIKIIRRYSKKAIIIVGTPTWSQDVDVAADSPLKGSNLMYTLHFYAATHKEWIQDKLKTAHKKGLPVIVTEFSICDSSGSGSLDKASGNKWMRLLNRYNISYASWSLCNKNESSALISSGCSKTAGWSRKDLSPAGKWYFNKTT
jgi:endoglucanase